MRSRDVRATTAGLLFIAATAASFMATALRGSLLKGPDFLATVALAQVAGHAGGRPYPAPPGR